MEIAQVLGSSPTFAPLAEASLAQLARCARRVRFADGAPVLAVGGIADAFYLLERGHVTIATGADGGELAIETVGPGDIVGWSWLFPPYRWHLDAVAVGTVDAIAFDAEGIRYAIRTDTAFGVDLLQAIVKVLAERLQATRGRLVDLAGHAAQ